MIFCYDSWLQCEIKASAVHLFPIYLKEYLFVLYSEEKPFCNWYVRPYYMHHTIRNMFKKVQIAVERLCFRNTVQSLYLLNPNFQASIYFL